MKKSHFTEEQMAYALKQTELGTAVGEICRKMGISEATFYVWRKKYGGLGPSELKRLRLLEDENRKLKQRVADLSLDKAMLQEVVTKKTLRPTQRRAWVGQLQERFGASERRALRIMSMSRSSYSYQAKARDSSAIRQRMREITQTRIHYGCERVLSCCGVRAGGTITSACTVFMSWKACHCGFAGRVAAGAPVVASRSGWQQRPTRRGVWTSSATRSSMVVVFGY